jgi:hypothetical protein
MSRHVAESRPQMNNSSGQIFGLYIILNISRSKAIRVFKSNGCDLALIAHYSSGVRKFDHGHHFFLCSVRANPGPVKLKVTTGGHRDAGARNLAFIIVTGTVRFGTVTVKEVAGKDSDRHAASHGDHNGDRDRL